MIPVHLRTVDGILLTNLIFTCYVCKVLKSFKAMNGKEIQGSKERNAKIYDKDKKVDCGVCKDKIIHDKWFHCDSGKHDKGAEVDVCLSCGIEACNIWKNWKNSNKDNV